MGELTEFEIKAYNNFLETVGLPKPVSEPWSQDQVEDFNAAPPARQKLMLFEWGYDKAHEAIAKIYFPGLLSPQEQDRYEEERREQKREKREKLFEKKYHKVMFWIAVATLLASVLGLFKGCDLF